MKHTSLRILSTILASCMIVAMFPASAGADELTEDVREPISVEREETGEDLDAADLIDLEADISVSDETENEKNDEITEEAAGDPDVDKAAIDKPKPKKVTYDNTGENPKLTCEYEDADGKTWAEFYFLGKEAKDGDPKGIGIVETGGKKYHIMGIDSTNAPYKKSGTWIVEGNGMYFGDSGKKPQPGETVSFVIETGKNSDGVVSDPVQLKVPSEGQKTETVFEEEQKTAKLPAGKKLVYNKSKQTGVASGTGYTLSGVYEATDAGEYKATATLESGYKWSDGNTQSSREIKWSITAAPISEIKFKNSKTEFTFNDKYQFPQIERVKAKVAKNKYITVPKSQYTVVKPGKSKNVGKYKLTVKSKSGSKNYKGKITEEYSIKPKYEKKLDKVSIKSLDGKNKSIKVKWKRLDKKKKEKIQKIQIQYSKNSNFAKAKSKTVSSSKTSSTISGLKADTKYYVRIRAYTNKGNIVEVSGWSFKKSVKTKK